MTGRWWEGVACHSPRCAAPAGQPCNLPAGHVHAIRYSDAQRALPPAPLLAYFDRDLLQRDPENTPLHTLIPWKDNTTP